MDEPNKQDQGKDSFFEKMREKARLNREINYIGDHTLEVLSGILVFVGLVLSFFYIHLGGALIGLGFGICFYPDFRNYFLHFRDSYTALGLFKTLVGVATLLYFLLSIPAFILAATLGFALMYLIGWAFKK